MSKHIKSKHIKTYVGNFPLRNGTHYTTCTSAELSSLKVSSSLSHILRLPASGPKIAQKYLHSPVLFNRPSIGKVKFDVRYIILLRSVEPLEVYAYNRFWLRFANIPFSLEQLDVYEKHFTVMNYNDADLQQMFCHDFIKLFEEQNPGHLWKDVESSIFSMFRGVFEVRPNCSLCKVSSLNLRVRLLYRLLAGLVHVLREERCMPLT